MKVYIASFFADKDRVLTRAKELEKLGIECTSRWATEHVPANSEISDVTPDYLRSTAVLDLDDIIRSEKVVLTVPTSGEMSSLSLSSLARGGRHFEAGFMYGLMTCLRSLQKPTKRELLILGPRENVFHFLDGDKEARSYPVVKQFDTWEQVKQYLSEGK